MEPMISQPVQGTRNVTIYPYLRKIDLMSSNSYLLSSPGQIVLIDPGVFGNGEFTTIWSMSNRCHTSIRTRDLDLV